MQLVKSHRNNPLRQRLFLNEVFNFRHCVETESHRKSRRRVGATDRKPPQRNAELRVEAQHCEENACVEGHKDHENPLGRGRLQFQRVKGERRCDPKHREGGKVYEGKSRDQAEINGD